MDCKSQWQGHKQESRRPKGATGDSRGKNNSRPSYGLQITMAGTQTREPPPEGGNRRQPRQEQQLSPLWTANHNGRDTNKRAAARRGQPAKGAARATAEPLVDCKSQWQGHKQESRGNRRKARQEQQPSPLWTANHNGRDTSKRAAARRGQPAKGAARATAKPLMGCKSQWQGHKQESRRPKGATGERRGKSNSRAPYGLQITMAGTQTREPPPEGGNRRKARQEQQPSPLWTANHNGRDTNKRAAARRGQPATAAARATAEPLMDCKSQWQGHKQESRRPKGATGDSRGKSNS